MTKKRSQKETEKKPTDSRDGQGRFLPGNGGGPGRPAGRSEVMRLVEELLAANAKALTDSLIKRAMAGHAKALELAFARLAPVRRERPVEVRLPDQQGQCGLVAGHDALLQQVASGEIAPSEAKAIADLLELRRRAVETTEIEARLAAIEARLPGGAASLPH